MCCLFLTSQQAFLVSRWSKQHARLLDMSNIEEPGVCLSSSSSTCMSGLKIWRRSMPNQKRAGARPNPRGIQGRIANSRLASTLVGNSARKRMLLKVRPLGTSSHLPSAASHCARPWLVACVLKRKCGASTVQRVLLPCPGDMTKRRLNRSKTSRASAWLQLIPQRGSLHKTTCGSTWRCMRRRGWCWRCRAGGNKSARTGT